MLNPLPRRYLELSNNYLKKLLVPKNFYHLIQGDCLKVLPTLKDESVDLVITSPPYNKGLYDKHTPHPTDVWKQRNIIYGDFRDNLPEEEYQRQQRYVLSEMVRVIKKEGSIFYNHKSRIVNHKILFPLWVFDFNVRQMIIWNRGSTPQLAPIRFYPTTEYLFWITKMSVQPKFYRRGRFDKEVWNIPCDISLDHPASFPDELVKNCVLSTTDENDLILDMYVGCGTTMKVAQDLGRNCVGIELNPEYCEIVKKRCFGRTFLDREVEYKFEEL